MVYALFPAGWKVRNALDVPPGVASSGQRAVETMSHGAYPDFIYRDPAKKYYPQFEDPEQPAFGSSFAAFSRILWKRAKEHPGRYLRWYLLEKPRHAWNWGIYQGMGDVFVYAVRTSFFMTSEIGFRVHTLMRYSYPCVLFLALIGMGLFWFRDFSKQTVPQALYLLLLYFTLLWMVFAPWPRYSVPLRPLLYPLAVWSASGYAVLLKRLLRKKSADTD